MIYQLLRGFLIFCVHQLDVTIFRPNFPVYFSVATFFFTYLIIFHTDLSLLYMSQIQYSLVHRLLWKLLKMYLQNQKVFWSFRYNTLWSTNFFRNFCRIISKIKNFLGSSTFSAIFFLGGLPTPSRILDFLRSPVECHIIPPKFSSVFQPCNIFFPHTNHLILFPLLYTLPIQYSWKFLKIYLQNQKLFWSFRYNTSPPPVAMTFQTSLVAMTFGTPLVYVECKIINVTIYSIFLCCVVFYGTYRYLTLA